MQDLTNMEITLTKEQKIEVLLHALEERYKSIHIIRDRVQNSCLWILGLFITAAGWLMQSTRHLAIREKIFFSLMIFIAVIIVRFFYLSDLEKGFKAQQKIQAKIENILGLCSSGVFASESIYPEKWASAGTKNGEGKFFLHNYLLIYIGTLFLLLSIWMA